MSEICRHSFGDSGYCEFPLGHKGHCIPPHPKTLQAERDHLRWEISELKPLFYQTQQERDAYRQENEALRLYGVNDDKG
jgi:hypothetical protein